MQLIAHKTPMSVCAAAPAIRSGVRLSRADVQCEVLQPGSARGERDVHILVKSTSGWRRRSPAARTGSLGTADVGSVVQLRVI